MGKRNHEWSETPQEFDLEASFTMDKEGGATMSVSGQKVLDKLNEIGYLLPILTSPQNGQGLRYNSTSEKWENSDPFRREVDATTSGTISLTENVYKILGTLGAVTFLLASPNRSDVVNEYRAKFVAGASTTITWPSGIIWFGGSAPTITNGKTYEVSFLEGLAICAEFA